MQFVEVKQNDLFATRLIDNPQKPFPEFGPLMRVGGSFVMLLAVTDGRLALPVQRRARGKGIAFNHSLTVGFGLGYRVRIRVAPKQPRARGRPMPLYVLCHEC